ncbi:hypothetical protein HanXRQr2_Chr02g0083501 [Helianthus annuus]|uniref:Uncharacterized protein n=1 Tax=Helianthus annuus TaxID=4232 RepID=A0A9K3JRG2_HELAN|nr:hypothetical protein HanXRQr2_Chr02g0083501 [Helianthus annuus]
MVGPCGMQFVTHFVSKRWGLNALQSENYRDHPCTFGKSWGLNTLQSANHMDHPCTFEKELNAILVPVVWAILPV